MVIINTYNEARSKTNQKEGGVALVNQNTLESLTGRNNGQGRFRSAVREALLIVAVAFVLGSISQFSLIVKSFNSSLIAQMQEWQLSQLKAKAQEMNPNIRFIDLVSAKKLYDESQAIFLDARDPDEYTKAHIAGALGLSVTSAIRGDVPVEEILPDKEAFLITYCDGGECDVSVELAKELVLKGYSNGFVLGEGYPGWEAAGYPVKKGGN